ncbi:MAG: hypothetical protein AAF081_01815 [Actinomycetota bacterium]
MTVGLVASSCTFELRDPGTTVACDPIEFEINTHGETFADHSFGAIIDSFEEFGDLVGRDVIYLGETETTYETHTADDPVLLELTWPETAPEFLGFSSATIVDDEYVSGWMYFNPIIAQAPAGMVRRLVMHEIGHLYGLLDVNDPTQMMDPTHKTDSWGSGDLAGLSITHDLGCNSSTNLVQALLATESGQLASIPDPAMNGEHFVDYLGPDTEFARLLENHINAHAHGMPITPADQPVATEPENIEPVEDEDGLLIGLTPTPDDDQSDVHQASCCCGCAAVTG